MQQKISWRAGTDLEEWYESGQVKILCVCGCARLGNSIKTNQQKPYGFCCLYWLSIEGWLPAYADRFSATEPK